jgi:prepilin-type N-terminal cleavage/methylation domain-containing protein
MSLRKTNSLQGFTLAELAIVLVIVSLLLTTLMPPLSAQMDQRAYNETSLWLNEGKEALLGYAMTHPAADGKPYLPCPDTDDDGLENRVGFACTSQEGRIPWADLGVSRWDSWTNRIRYRVHTNFSNSEVGFTLATAAPDLRVCAVNDCATTVATQLPVVLVSHGKNGAGAFNSTGATGGINGPSADADESENSDVDNDFVSHTQSSTFDDIVVWLPATILYNRMITAGRLP